jgi:hypothetical protein
VLSMPFEGNRRVRQEGWTMYVSLCLSIDQWEVKLSQRACVCVRMLIAVVICMKYRDCT